MATTLDLNQAQTGDTTNVVGSVKVPAKTLDAPVSGTETRWTNTNWTKQYGYFLQMPDLQSALILKAKWIVGRGYTADPETTVILDHISGSGKQTFRDILFNMKLVSLIGGAAYSEIILAGDKGKEILANLKPLNPEFMTEIYDESGILSRYEYNVPTKDGGKAMQEFKPEEIFQLDGVRVANQLHGLSCITPLEPTILADNESFLDVQKIMHRGAVPLIIWKLRTDDTTAITNFKNRITNARKYSEPDIFIPDDDNTATHEIVQVDASPQVLEWRTDIRNRFYRAIGLPQIVPGGGGQSTQSEANVIYLAHEMIVEDEQRYIAEQVWNQLHKRIKLTAPESMSPMLQQNAAKNGAPIQPGDVNPAAGRQ